MAGQAFRLQLRLNTPVILPRATPRLDILLAEAVRILHLDWERPLQASDMPLAWDDRLGGFCGSQLVFGTTAQHGMTAAHVAFPSHIQSLPFSEVSPPVSRRIKLDGGPYAPRLTERPALLAPYVLFYGIGNPTRCAELLALLTGLGREYASGYGHFSVESITRLDDTDTRWRQRPWPADQHDAHASQPYAPSMDSLVVCPGEEAQPVLRPPRILKEALHAA